MKECDLIFPIFETSDEITEYVRGLIKRDLSHKFAYISSAAHTHDKPVNSSQYRMADTELNLIKNKLGLLLSYSEPANLIIIDIGSGIRTEWNLTFWRLCGQRLGKHPAWI
jgi:hypothetical protein